MVQVIFYMAINSLRPRRNRRHFADNIFKCIFLNENAWIPINFSLKFVPMGPINNISVLVQIMAWRRPGDKPLSEPMIVSLPTHICVTRPQWVKKFANCEKASCIHLFFKYVEKIILVLTNLHPLSFSISSCNFQAQAWRGLYQYHIWQMLVMHQECAS